MVTDVIMCFDDDGIPLRVVDMEGTTRTPNPVRCIMDERGGCYSAIDLTDSRRQPFLELMQDVIDKWFSGKKIKNAIVLGAAGCALPRFLIKSFPEVDVVAVECSKTLITIAKKYFLKNLDTRRLRIVHDEAAKYLSRKSTSIKCDLIISDVFNGASVSERVYSASFFRAAKKSVVNAQNGVVLANLSGLEQSVLDEIINKALCEFSSVAVYRKNGRIVLAASADVDVASVLSWRKEECVGLYWKSYSRDERRFENATQN